MANLKFSGFTAAAAIDQTDSFLVGFDTDGGGANPTNNKWTFPEVAAGLPTFYAGDGTLSAARTLSMDGNDLTFDGGAAVYPTFNIGDITLYPNGQNNSAYPSKNSMQVRGLIRFPYYGAASPGLSWESYNTTVKAYGFSMYGGGGWTHNSGYSVIGPNFAWDSGNDLTARLGVIGVHNDNTSYAFRVQNSDLTDIFSVNNDTTTTVEKNLVIKGQGYTELNDIGTVATATWDIDWNNSNIQSITLNNGGAMTLNTPTNPKTGATYILKLIQGASPSTITWTASIFKWPAAAAPVLSTSAGQVDIVTLIYDGTNYYGTSTINLS